MIKEIEKTIEKYFPQKWSQGDVKFWMGDPRFDVDVEAINKNLNLPLRDFLLRGGKRWRPVLFLTTLNLFGLNWKKYLDIAFALELAHNATLIIDDIEDNAKLRRGKPTCHKIFGLDTAINTGAFAHFLPVRILQYKKGLSLNERTRIVEIYNEEMINVYFGQTLDIHWHKNTKDIKKSEYLEMCRLKTGGLVRMAVRMACVLAGKDAKIENDFKNFAELVGIAFQIKDDALEFTSDEKTFGKSFGNDITEGKMSLPVVLALEKSDKKSGDRLKNILQNHTRNKKLIKEAFVIIKKTGAVEEAVDYANRLIDEAWEDIETKLPKNRKKELEEFKNLTYFLVKRDK